MQADHDYKHGRHYATPHNIITLHECNLLPQREENTFPPDTVEQYLLFALYLTSITKHIWLQPSILEV